MAKCELNIGLERSDRTYKGGEKIAGNVQVTAHDDCECRKLTLALEWRTSGKGNVDEEQEEELELFTGAFHAGQTASYPFEFEAPYKPINYEGKLFSMHWYLLAQADIPGARDAQAEERLTLLPAKQSAEAEAAEEEVGEDKEENGEEENTRGSTSLEHTLDKFAESPVVPWVFAFGTVFALALLAMILLMIFQFGGRGLEGWAFFLFAITVILLVGTRSALFRYIARRKLGPVDVQLSTEEVRAGEAVACTIRFRPRVEAELKEATIELKAKEEVTKGSGKNRRTYTEVVHDENVTLATDRRVMADEGVVLEGKLQVPTTASPSFYAPDNTLEWLFVIHLNLRGWPDWKREFPVEVFS